MGSLQARPHTDRRKRKREERDVAVMALLADGGRGWSQNRVLWGLLYLFSNGDDLS